MEKQKISPVTIIKGAVYFLGFPLLLLLLSGNWGWLQAWVYLALSYLATFISRALLTRIHPDLITERSRYSEQTDTKPWDKVLGPLVALWMPLAYFATAGLDKRFGWSGTIPVWLQIIGWVITLAGFLLSNWALVENRFFSAVVRIQKDRGQTVVESGPYRILRHPGYAGAVLVALTFPLILGTLWAFIPVLGFLVAIILRTAKEDKMLQEELPGYMDYCQKTRYRLFPGIW